MGKETSSVYSSRTSLQTTIPKKIAEEMGLTGEEKLLWEITGEGEAKIKKLV